MLVRWNGLWKGMSGQNKANWQQAANKLQLNFVDRPEAFAVAAFIVVAVDVNAGACHKNAAAENLLLASN